MAENTAKKMLYNLNETFTNIAEYVLSYFYVDSGEGEKRLDVLNMFLAGWVLLGIMVYLLGTFIANALQSNGETAQEEPVKSESDNAEKEVSKTDLKEAPAKPNKEKAPKEEKIVCRSIEEVAGAPRIGALSRVPIANGKDAGSVRWINLILVWLHTTPKLDLLIDCWIHSINERAAKVAPESGNVVTFEKLVEGCPLPELRDVQVSGESSNNVTMTSKVLAKQLVFLLLVTRNKGKDKSTSEYLLNIDELDGKLKVTCNTEDKLLVVKFIDNPDVKLNLKLSKNGALKESALDQRAFEDSITEVAIQALGSAVVDLHLSRDPDFPNYVRDKGSISPSSFGSAIDAEDAVARHEQRLFVKVIKASNLGADKGCQEAYCVVEMDDPPQKFQTAPIKATISPFWDEHFLFNLKNSSAEVLFEIFDKSKPSGENFLGLGIVSVEELLKNPSQRQIITLQPRPLENDKVTGSLTAEFLFMEGSEIPIRQQAGRTVETNSRVTSRGKIITTTTIKKSDEEDGLSPACCHPLIESESSSKKEGSLSSFNPSLPLSNKSSSLPRDSSRNFKETELPNVVLRKSFIPNGLNKINSQSSSLRASEPSLFRNNSNLKPNFEVPIIKPDFDKITLLKKPSNRLKKCVSQDISTVLSQNWFKFDRERRNSMDNLTLNENNDNVSLEKILSDEILENNNNYKPVNNFLVDFDHVILANDGFRSSSSQMVVEISPVIRSSFDHELDLPPLEVPNSPTPKPQPPATKSPFSLAGLTKGTETRVTLAAPNDTFDSSLTEVSLASVQSDSSNLEPKSSSNKKLKGRKWLLSKFKPKKKRKTAKDSIEDSEPLTDTALKEIEQMGKTGMSTNKSTLIIHSVQREVVRPTLKVKVDKDGRWHEVPAPQANGDHSGSASPSSPTTKAPSAAGSASSSDKEDRSARTKERKSFMGTLRKRLSFKKNRSKSVDPNGVQDGQQSSTGSRSASNDRSKSAPGSREQSAGRHPSHLGVPGGAGSARSSISEGSGFSGASSRTYINENSTLVIEIDENGITKHYLIPFSLATRSKWRKRGVKLHIYNDHTFVAKHVSGSVMCQVCTRHFPRRPGKQAYSCRDCDLQVHKTCHVKVEGVCPNSTIQSLEMEYVQDPRIKSTTS